MVMTYDFAEIERNKGKIEPFMQLIKDGLVTLQQAAERNFYKTPLAIFTYHIHK